MSNLRECFTCKHKLDIRYTKYGTVRGEPLCRECYISAGGVVYD